MTQAERDILEYLRKGYKAAAYDDNRSACLFRHSSPTATRWVPYNAVVGLLNDDRILVSRMTAGYTEYVLA